MAMGEERERERENGSSSRRSKRRRKSNATHLHGGGDSSLLPLTLAAALSNPKNPNSIPLLHSCLLRFLHFILPSEGLMDPMLALLPSLLRSRYTEIVSACAKILGAASLLSLEMNERIASDCEILKTLVSKTVSRNKSIAKVACNAVLDLATTSVGRHCLVELSALNYLMLGFIQVHKSSTSSISVGVKEGVVHLGVKHREEELLLLFFDVIVTLINSCNIEQLKKVSEQQRETSQVFLKQVWAEVREQMFACQNPNSRLYYVSNVTADDLVESVFRISLNALHCDLSNPSKSIISLFGPKESGLEKFLLNHWEASPCIMREVLKDIDARVEIFSPHSLMCPEKIPGFLFSTLQGMVSFPPIALDETDVLRFLLEVRGALSCLIKYQQDIRVVRTYSGCKTEELCFQNCLSTGCLKDSNSFCTGKISRCVEAYRSGYTIALNGMEFRFKNISAIADQIGSLLGQPSVAANLYVTPSDSQGLACHCDDHCVFVCQLLGSKQWMISPKPSVQLPRLHENLEGFSNSMAGSRHILVREGDVLYIPRGFLHEAHTISDASEDDDMGSKTSVHLTLGVGVEPPFEWEGFAHIALSCWSQNQKESPHIVSVSLLHVAIKLISEIEPVFRKACLVASGALLPDPVNSIDQMNRLIFNQLVNKINELSSCTDSVKFVRRAIQRNKDPFRWLRWIKHARDLHSVDIDEWLHLINELGDEVEVEDEFVRVKLRFCREVVFDEVKESFKLMHAKYEKTRKQYKNGMLSLHF